MVQLRKLGPSKWLYDNIPTNEDQEPEPEQQEESWFKKELAKGEANLSENEKHHRRAALRIGRTGLIPRSQRHRY